MWELGFGELPFTSGNPAGARSAGADNMNRITKDGSETQWQKTMAEVIER